MRHCYPPPLDHLCETAVLNLRTLAGIEPNEFNLRTGADFWDTFGPIVKKNQEEELLDCRGSRICLTRKALPIADRVLCDFAAL